MTIQVDGRIALNADVGDILVSLGAKYAQIWWDKDTAKLAIRPLKKQAHSAFKLTVWPRKRGSSLSARSFLNYIQWRSSKPYTTKVEWNNTEGVFEAELPRDKLGQLHETKGRKQE